jgi:hypothetical protein
MLEWWNSGRGIRPNIPTFQHSSIPIFHLDSSQHRALEFEPKTHIGGFSHALQS